MKHRIRFMTYNIHGCVGRGGQENPSPVLEVIREADADVVALQEVHDDDVADRSFLRGLESLGYPHLIYGQTLRKHLGPYGNVLMSRFPVSHFQRLAIGEGLFEPRGAIRALINAPFGKVRVTATHLGLAQRERYQQVTKLMDWYESRTDGVDVLLGDLNEWWPFSRTFRRLASAYPYGSGIRSFPARWPIFPLDRIYIRGALESVRFERLDSFFGRRASDHRAITATVNV